MLGEPLKVNAAHFSRRDPSAVRLYVIWGDGVVDHIGCGPCRLEHVYVAAGIYHLAAVVTDGQAEGASAFTRVGKTFEVEVLPRPPSPRPGPSPAL